MPEFLEHGAMIDTGASDTCIDYRIAHALKLRQIDQRTIGTVGGPDPGRGVSGRAGNPAAELQAPGPVLRAEDRTHQLQRPDWPLGAEGVSVHVRRPRQSSATSRGRRARRITRTTSRPNVYQVAHPARIPRILPTMNKLSAGSVFLLCLFLGIIFEQVAIGIIAGLILGAGAGKVTAPKSGPEA